MAASQEEIDPARVLDPPTWVAEYRYAGDLIIRAIGESRAFSPMYRLRLCLPFCPP